MVTVADSYLPAAQTWIFYVAGAALLALLATRLFPIRIVEYTLQQRKLRGLRYFFLLLLNTLVGTLFAAGGAGLALVGWKTLDVIGVQEKVKSLLALLSRFLPVELPFNGSLLAWLPYACMSAGLGLALVGVGLWLRRQDARSTAATLITAWAGLAAAAWAGLILCPPLFFKDQTTLFFWAGLVCLLALAGLFRLLTHPYLRRLYAQAES